MGKISRKAVPAAATTFPSTTPTNTAAAATPPYYHQLSSTALNYWEEDRSSRLHAPPPMSSAPAAESYQLESLHSAEVDAGKPPSPSPSAASIDPSQVRWLKNQRSRGWELCKIVFRACGTLFSAIVLGICLAWYSYRPNLAVDVWPGILLVGAFPSFFWDLAEFLTLCARYGRGITPKALIGLELVLSVVSAVAAGWVGLQLSWMDGDPANNPASLALSACTLTGINAFIRFCLFIRACVERSREIRRRRPRVMYIPETGQTVYVVAKPFPKLPTWQSQNSARAPSFPRSPQPSSPLGATEPVAAFPDFTESPRPETSPPPLPERPGHQHALPSAIKRKPVRGLPPRTTPGDRDRHLRPSMRPPPDDYVPDEAELERMRRGDAQPQLILPGDVDLKFATGANGMTPAAGESREGKFRLNKNLVLGESSRGGAGGARTRSM
ncbi:hypothetical protein RB213_014204 [Colletotrichum asianum]